MANELALLKKIKTNLVGLGLSVTDNGTSLVSSGIIISLVDPVVPAPLSGIDPSVSPYVGIKACAAHSIKLKGAAGENTLDAIFANIGDVKTLATCARFANSLVLEAGDSTTELGFILGDIDNLMMGQ
jgi:hypothetical protein